MKYFNRKHTIQAALENRLSTASLLLYCILLYLLIPDPAHANNGLNQIGFGAESMGMAGADLALARNSAALNSNPAGLTQISDAQLDLNMALGYAGGIRHRDAFGNDSANTNEWLSLNTLGYATLLDGSDLSIGVGLFAQGGAGSEFEDLNTAFGTVDDLSVAFRIARITPGLAWRPAEKLSFGASLVITYSALEQQVFPDTSFQGPTLQESFFGTHVSGMEALDTGYKLGLMYQPSDSLNIGIAYTSPVDIDMDGGTMVADMTALGLGKVGYRDIEASGLDQPQELGIGLAYQYTPRLLLAFELNWIDWSKAVREGRLYASDPDNSAAPSELELKTTHNWRDQYVFVLAAAYRLDSGLLLRSGYNYGRNPIPSQHLSPLLNVITEHHLTLGFGWPISPAWEIEGAFEWNLRNSQRYSNEELPFGEDAEETGELLALHLSLSHRW